MTLPILESRRTLLNLAHLFTIGEVFG